MKKIAVVAAMALLSAACGGGESGGFDPNAGFSQGADGELRSLAYAYQPDSSLTYGYNIDMDVSMDADIDAPDGFGEMTMGMSMAGSIAYGVSAGAEEGTVELTIDSSLSDFSVSELTVDGESMPAELLGLNDPDLAGVGELIPPMTVVVDSSGDILEMQVGDVAVPSDLLATFGGGSFGDPTGMGMLGSLFGPELPDDQVRIGATWTTTDTQEVPFVGEMTVVTNHEIVGEESMAGRDTFVIESTAQMSPLSISFADMLESLKDPATMAALGMAGEDIDAAQLEADLFESMDFDFSMDISYDKLETKTWFDYQAGVMVSTDADMVMTMKMKIDTPEGGGDMTMKANMGMAMLLTADGASV